MLIYWRVHYIKFHYTTLHYTTRHYTTTTPHTHTHTYISRCIHASMPPVIHIPPRCCFTSFEVATLQYSFQDSQCTCWVSKSEFHSAIVKFHRTSVQFQNATATHAFAFICIHLHASRHECIQTYLILRYLQISVVSYGGFLKWGKPKSPWVSILSHGLMTWMIWECPHILGNLHI